MNGTPRVLFVYYTFSQQTGRVVDAMAEAFAARGCDVTKALIKFTDPRYTDRFQGVPMKWAVMRIVGMLPAQLRRASGEIEIPEAAKSGDYDLVVIGGPTWWLTACMPVRTYLKDEAAQKVLNGKPFAGFSVSRRYWKGNIGTIKELGEAAGGSWLGEIHFLAAGNQVKSMLSWLSYMRSGEIKEKAWGLKVPPTNLQPGFEQEAQQFAHALADRVLSKTAVAEEH